jgi:hypothetical protein
MVDSPNGMFSEDMFDASVIELEQLITGLDKERIHEVWHVFSLDQKSKHFIVLYDEAAHLCTCLTLINRGIVCRHFFATMLSSMTAKFHIALVSQRWYTETSMTTVSSTLKNEPAIAAVSNKEVGMFEYDMEVTNFTFLENLRGQHIFTKEICQEMTRRQQWGKGFGIMKKTLDLAITTGRSEELYNLHLKLAKEMETAIAAKNGQAVEQDDSIEFACTISNPVHVRTKGRKSKRAKSFNDETNRNHKGKKRKTLEFDQHKNRAATTHLKQICTSLENTPDGGMYLIFISFILVICLSY